MWAYEEVDPPKLGTLGLASLNWDIADFLKTRPSLRYIRCSREFARSTSGACIRKEIHRTNWTVWSSISRSLKVITSDILYTYDVLLAIYTVSQKNPCDYVFDDNLNSKRPIVIIFGTVIT